jgi:hypothetical protein
LTAFPPPVVATIVNVPAAAPAAVGLNTTLMVQLPPASVGVAHVPGVAESANGAATTRFVIGSSGVVESAVTVTDCVALVAPTATSPKPAGTAVTFAVWPKAAAATKRRIPPARTAVLRIVLKLFVSMVLLSVSWIRR